MSLIKCPSCGCGSALLTVYSKKKEDTELITKLRILHNQKKYQEILDITQPIYDKNKHDLRNMNATILLFHDHAQTKLNPDWYDKITAESW